MARAPNEARAAARVCEYSKPRSHVHLSASHTPHRSTALLRCPPATLASEPYALPRLGTPLHTSDPHSFAPPISRQICWRCPPANPDNTPRALQMLTSAPCPLFCMKGNRSAGAAYLRLRQFPLHYIEVCNLPPVPLFPSGRQIYWHCPPATLTRRLLFRLRMRRTWCPRTSATCSALCCIPTRTGRGASGGQCGSAQEDDDGVEFRPACSALCCAPAEMGRGASGAEEQEVES